MTTLTVYDDGSGPAIHAGGAVQGGGFLIAKWDGASWIPLGSGVNGPVNALAVYDDGSGPGLYAGGDFTTAGGISANRIARWDGASWEPLAGGLTGGFGAAVHALATFDDGDGEALFVGGVFNRADGVIRRNFVRWDGTSWQRVGDGDDWGTVRSLMKMDDGDGLALWIGGWYQEAPEPLLGHVIRWDGETFEVLGAGMDEIHAIAAFDDGRGALLHAACRLTFEGEDVEAVARWEAPSWEVLGRGLNGGVHALAVHDDGSGPALFVGGEFHAAGGVHAQRIAKWDGASWSALGSGVDYQGAPIVRALKVHDDGGGPALYAGGDFASAGSVAALGVAKWNGSTWSALGSGAFTTYALEEFDDGTGPALFAGGYFTTAGGVPANSIAKWDGATWSALGSGVNGNFGHGLAHALAVFDDGNGPALYVGGTFTSAGGVPANGLARWDGASWTAIPGFGGGDVGSLLATEDGQGPALYAGGQFGVERWDGASWSALGLGVNGFVTSLAAGQDASGWSLFVGGGISSAGGTAVNDVARWNGSSWSALGGGLAVGYEEWVTSLAIFDDGGGPALCAGGKFSSAPDSGDSNLAYWGCDTRAPTLACPPAIRVLDRLDGAPGEVVTFVVTAEDDHDPYPDVTCVPPSGSVFPRGTTVVTCAASDASGNQATCQFAVTVESKKARRH